MEAGAFCILYPTTCDSCFPVWQVGTVPVLSPVCTLGGAASHPSRWLFLQLEVACSACPAWYLADVLRTALCMSLELPLCGSLSCNPLPANCWRFPPSRLHIRHSEWSPDSAWVLLPWAAARKLSQGSKRGKPQFCLICSPHFRAHCPSLPDI